MDKKTVIVTGGAQGIGKTTVKRFLEAGYIAAIFESDKEALLETEKEMDNLHAFFLLCNVSDEEQVKTAINKTVEKTGRIDVVVNNAAISINKPVESLTIGEWNRVIGANLTGPFLCAKYSARYLRINKGCIINIASTRAFMSEADTEAYSASKGGIVALTHALAVSLGPDIRVNCISPGWIDVSGNKKTTARKNIVLSEADHQQHPAGRVGEADDIARLLLFLSNPENSFITGQNFTVDGGMTKKMIYV